MSRQIIREHKRQMRSAHQPGAGAEHVQLAQESALALLARSIGFGHGRLAVIRLSMAVQVGAPVPSGHWAYCESVARESQDSQLQQIWLAAAAHALHHGAH